MNQMKETPEIDLSISSVKHNLDNCPHILSEENNQVDLNSYKKRYPANFFYYNTVNDKIFCLEPNSEGFSIYLKVGNPPTWLEVKGEGVKKFLEVINVQKENHIETMKIIDRKYF